MSSSSLSRSFCGQKSAPSLTLAAAVPPQRFPGAVLERTSKSGVTHAVRGTGGRSQRGSNRTPDSAVTALQTVTVDHFRAPPPRPAASVITAADAVKPPRPRPAPRPPRTGPHAPRPPSRPAPPDTSRPPRTHGNWPKRFPHPNRAAPGHPHPTARHRLPPGPSPQPPRLPPSRSPAGTPRLPPPSPARPQPPPPRLPPPRSPQARPGRPAPPFSSPGPARRIASHRAGRTAVRRRRRRPPVPAPAPAPALCAWRRGVVGGGVERSSSAVRAVLERGDRWCPQG